LRTSTIMSAPTAWRRSATSSPDRVECPIVKNGRIPPSASPNMPMLPAASGADASTRYHRDDRAEHHDAGPTRETANVGISPQKGPAQSMKSTTLTSISHGPPLETLLSEIRGCRACADEFAHEPRPVVWVKPETRLLICGQAPGRRVHESGLPFDDPSGDRLRSWLGIDRETFYGNPRIGIAAMAFCFPGTNPKGGDYPPPKRCAALWRARLLAELPKVELTLLVGSY